MAIVGEEIGRNYTSKATRNTMDTKYEINPEMQRRLDQWHYHRPNIGQPERFQTINNATRDLARLIMELTPPGRQQSIALTHLEDVRMRANSAIVLDEQSLNG